MPLLAPMLAVLGALAAGAAPPADAPPHALQVATADARSAPVPQNGADTEALRAMLKRIRLPPGFTIELFAVVPGARHIAVAPDGDALFVGTRRATVWAVRLHPGATRADEVRSFAPGMNYVLPNGVCWTADGALIVAELNRVLRFDAAEAALGASTVAVTELVPRGRLIPPAEESAGHGARVCRVGPDGRLYITLGQPFNVPPRDKLALYREWGLGGIVRLNAADGSAREVFAIGIRNSVGLDFNPKDGTLWFTDNQTDGMGDDIPPGTIQRATRAGQFFGYPWVEGGVRITEHGYDKDPLPPGVVAPQALMDAHAADLGLVFYTGRRFPARYRGGIFSAQHGSWNRSRPIGARVMFTPLKPDGSAGRPEVFAEGWLDAASGSYRGRPVDVAVLPDGSLLVSDDLAGALYRIAYAGP